ncbi:MAG: hypothetical protein NTU94_09545 [Planctomycetota bacterium]|nr:hypothetical protein [Planctomycetota bacterium]
MNLTKAALAAMALPALLAATARADMTTVGSSGETNFVQILNHIYGGSFVGASFGGPSYTNGSVTATRVDDFVIQGSNRVPGSNVDVVTGGPGLPTTDQVWDDGFTSAVAEARFAGYSQKFGYFEGASGVSYTPLFDVTGSDFDVTGSAALDMTGHTWRWVRDGDNGQQSSLQTDNVSNADHLLTYRITSTDPKFNDGQTTWLLFWEDLNPNCKDNLYRYKLDSDFNDLVVEIRAVPAPAAIGLGMLGLGLVGWYMRRFA